MSNCEAVLVDSSHGGGTDFTRCIKPHAHKKRDHISASGALWDDNFSAAAYLVGVSFLTPKEYRVASCDIDGCFIHSRRS